MTFALQYTEWIRARMVDVPIVTSRFCGDLSGLKILDIGCGDMMMDIGLQSLNPAHITGIDVRVPDFDVLQHAEREVSVAGYAVPSDCKDRLAHRVYGGKTLPFPDNSFDLVFSWGVFEHVSYPKITLSEARRVVKPEGRIFVVVWPWFHSFHGSHLVEYIPEPYFHLRRSERWVWEQLNQYLASHPELAEEHVRFLRPEGYTGRSFLLEVMWREYRALNRYSARRFLRDAVNLGLIAEKVEAQIEEHPTAPKVSSEVYADLVTAGSMVLFRPGKTWKAATRLDRLREFLL
jgi:ubiquinone/menaquinone biosynthesis C-methylase UbiE